MSEVRGRLQQWLEALAAEPSEGVRRLRCAAAPVPAAAAFAKVQEKLPQLAYSNIEQAERLAQCGQWLAHDLGDTQLHGIAERGSGHVAYVSGRYAEAAAHYRKSIQLLDSVGAEVEVGRTLSSAIQTLLYLGCFEDATRFAERARGIFERAGDGLRIARLSSNCGNIWYRQDHYEKALTCYEEAYNGLCVHGQPTDVAAALSNLAVCRISLGQFKQALLTYRAAREHCERYGLSRLIAAADYNIAYLHFFQGRYTEALQLYSLTKQGCLDAGDPYHAALCDLDESELFLELNLFEEAQQSALAAIQAFDSLAMPYERAKAMAFASLAEAKMGQKRIANARLKAAESYFRSTGNSYWLSTLQLFRAFALEHSGKVTEALACCRRAELGYKRAGSSYRSLLCLLYRLRLQIKSGAWREAQAVLPTEQADLPQPIWYQLHLLRGAIAEAKRSNKEAEMHYRAACSHLEQLRGQTSTLAQRLAMVEDRCEVYHRLAVLAMQTSPRDEDELFHLFEQFRSRTLFEAIFAGPGPGMKIDLAIESVESELHACYRRLEAQDASAEGARDVRPIRQRIIEREQELKGMFARSRPRLAHDPLDVREAITAESLRHSLPQRTTLIEWAILQDRIYACVLDANQTRIVQVASAGEVRSNSRLLQFQIERHVAGSTPAMAGDGPVQHHLRVLYRALFEPIREHISGSSLLLVPHRFLHALPFHAFWDGSRYLIDDYEIQYAPSGSVFAACSARHRRAEQAVILAFSDAKAPSIAWEAARIVELFPGATCISGALATREAFRRHAGRCGVLHIAAHARFRPENAMFSTLLLADGGVPLWEVWQTPISAQLVVLSGCGTGLNRLTGGDELIGFVRAFLGAGANQVVASLWDVHDESAALFVEAFYGSWVQTRSAPESVRVAMQKVRLRYPNSSQWAPFVVWGGKNS